MAQALNESESEHAWEEQSEAWAISYADVLMVLLCFFILFFSTNREKALPKISKYLNTLQKVEPLPAKNTSAETKAFTDEIKTALGKEAKIIESKNGEQIQINLSDDLFSAGSYRLNAAGDAEVDALLRRLIPLRSEVEIAITGHSDSQPVTASRSRLIEGNFDLSALRASKVIQRAITLGFDPQTLRISSASAQNERNTRSVSITLTPKNRARPEELLNVFLFAYAVSSANANIPAPPYHGGDFWNPGARLWIYDGPEDCHGAQSAKQTQSTH